jgi:hypothetical protein
VITDDLFAEFDALAQEYGWDALGQPRQHVRRYGKAVHDVAADVTRQVTVTAYSNATGTAIRRVSRTSVDTHGERTGRVLDGRARSKRDQVVSWLRWSHADVMYQ